jgi:hypothetical protein
MGFDSPEALQPVHGLEITPLEAILPVTFGAYRPQHQNGQATLWRYLLILLTRVTSACANS